jgi:hypothetical protein
LSNPVDKREFTVVIVLVTLLGGLGCRGAEDPGYWRDPVGTSGVLGNRPEMTLELLVGKELRA